MLTLENVRKGRGYTQEYMASQLSVAVSTYNQYENGTRSVPRKIAESVAKVLGVEIGEIFLATKFTVSKI